MEVYVYIDGEFQARESLAGDIANFISKKIRQLTEQGKQTVRTHHNEFEHAVTGRSVRLDITTRR